MTDYSIDNDGYLVTADPQHGQKVRIRKATPEEVRLYDESKTWTKEVWDAVHAGAKHLADTIDQQVMDEVMNYNFFVYENDDPATHEYHPVSKDWNRYEFETFEEAEQYVAEWLGDHFYPGPGVIQVDELYPYNPYGDAILISSVRLNSWQHDETDG